jgi:trans-aconitate 2-methyltransferase
MLKTEDWSASTYLRFEDERTRPAAELLARVPLASAARVVDIGCGPGNSTELLVRRYPEADVLGLDSSPDMLATAAKRLPEIRFAQADIAAWTPEAPVDLLYGNAVLQWLPDHETLFPRLMAQLAPGGAFAAQMPDNLGEPSHAIMREVAQDPRWGGRLDGAAASRTRILTLEAYYDLLLPQAAAVDVWRTTYVHPLNGAQAISDWLSSTGLRPFLNPLSAEERTTFVKLYVERIREAYPERANGKVLLRFPRLFMVAVKR